jgi:hypothetical protein
MECILQPFYIMRFQIFTAISMNMAGDGGSKLLLNVCQYQTDYTALHPSRQAISFLFSSSNKAHRNRAEES